MENTQQYSALCIDRCKSGCAAVLRQTSANNVLIASYANRIFLTALNLQFENN
jgi:hypothetical protein